MMKTNKKLMWIVIIFSLIISIGCAFFFPSNVGKEQVISEVTLNNEKSIIQQGIEGITLSSKKVTKIYYKGNLLGIIKNPDLIEQTIKELEESYANTSYAGSKLSLSDDLYTLTQNTFWEYEDKDFAIISYLKNRNLFVTKATQIDIYGEDLQIVDTIYVSNLDDFTNALKRFALCFVDESVFNRLEAEEPIPDLTSYGTQQKNVYVENLIKSTVTGAAVEEIFYDEESVFSYLCYGRNKELKYYVVEEYDTIAGVGQKTGLSVRQIMALNPSLRNPEQALTVGEQLLVTYFDSCINVVVEQQRIAKVVTYAPATEYVVNPDVMPGSMRKVRDAKNGYNDVTYTEIYVNGEMASYRADQTIVVEEPISAVYEVGAGEAIFDPGELNFRLPCDYAELICSWRCYEGHNGVDFINYANRYGELLACESGTIVGRGYQSDMGYYYFIRHSSEYELDYMHMNQPGFFAPGTVVTKGQVIGQIGNTGRSTTPHVHIAVWYNGTRVDPCSPGLLPCQDARQTGR